MNKLILLGSILYLLSPAALAMPWHNNPTNAVYVCDKTSAEYHLSVKYGDTKVPLRYLHIWEQHTSWPRAVSWLNNISIEYHTNQDPQTKRAEIDSLALQSTFGLGNMWSSSKFISVECRTPKDPRAPVYCAEIDNWASANEARRGTQCHES